MITQTLSPKPAVISPLQLEVILSMRAFVQGTVNQFLKPVSESWQPAAYLPDFARESWPEDVKGFQAAAKELPDEVLVALVGDMVTEEALPSYQTWLNGLEGLKDHSGDGENPWAQWSRGWTAEENRHGDLLNKYLYLTGRVDMNAVEVTIQNLIRNGFNPLTHNDPYQGFVYTSFQECATKISHRNVAILASRAGEERLHEICGIIAGDEARHEKAYQAFMKKIFEIDPNGAVIAFAKMMKSKVVMPARLMDDNRSQGLFDGFSDVAQRIGVYTARDYTGIIEHLLNIWNVRELTGLSAEAAKAQEYVCSLPERYTKLADRRSPSAAKEPVKRKFSWIYDRQV